MRRWGAAASNGVVPCNRVEGVVGEVGEVGLGAGEAQEPESAACAGAAMVFVSRPSSGGGAEEGTRPTARVVCKKARIASFAKWEGDASALHNPERASLEFRFRRFRNRCLP
jgi:hypothetical protein